jgi:DNA (cytosine-5)-methyltransferase 1
MTFRYGSVCSGIEAATAAWHHMGWEAAFFSEIEKFPCAVLEHHYPDVPLHGDFTTIKENEYGKIDLLVGGTPCQSFSVAGLRGGLDDDRGNLALEFCRLAQREQPRWIVWENVPGVLSSNGGRDFGSILGALENIGYGLAYRVLDAQYFGVAQRRRRVFVVGYLGDWRPAAAVLFERHSMSGHPAPSRQARKEAATEAATGTGGSGGNGGARSDLAGPLTAGMHKGPRGTEAVESGHVLAFSAKDYGNDVSDNISPTLRSGGAYGANGGVMPAVAYAIQDTPDVVGTLRAHHPGTAGTQSDTDHIVATYPINSMNAFRSPDAAPSTGLGVGHDGEAMYTLTKGDHHAIAFSSNMSVPDCQTDGTTPTLKLGGHGGGNPPAVAYSIMPMNSGKDYKARETDISQPLMAGGPVGGNQGGDFIVTPFDTTQLTSPYNYSNPQGGDPCHPLAAGAHPPAVTFAIQDVRGLDKKQNGKGWSDEGVSYTVDTHATQGVAQADERAVAFQPTADCLTAAYGAVV